MSANDPHRNAFAGRGEMPDDTALTTALGPSRAAWDELIGWLAADQGVTLREWRSYSLKAGWALRLQCGKRTVVWLAPYAGGGFGANFVLGAAAMAAARECRLPASGAKALAAAVRYPEGYGVRLTVNNTRDLGAVKKLVPVKIAH